MPVDKARETQDELLATSVRMEGLQQSADNLLSAANRLQDNVRMETEYWSQILTISDKGWNVCRIPGQQHRLGVRFGFSESSPEFSRRGIAALNASSEGNITLERGIGSEPKALRAVMRKEGKLVGTSRLPEVRDANETTLEARIRHARDSLYDEELYHEMIRESRTLASLGVAMKGSTVRLGSFTSDLEVSLDLVSLDDGHGLQENSSGEEDALSQAIVLAARLLLSRAHHVRMKKRSEKPAPLGKKQKEEGPEVLPILLPIMSFVMHRSALGQMNAYLDTLTDMLNTAGVQNTHKNLQFSFRENMEIASSEDLINTLLETWKSSADLKITAPEDKETAFDFKVETTLGFNSFGSSFMLSPQSRSEPYRFKSIADMISATDQKLASGLAKSLLTNLGEDWACNEREALLIRDTGSGEKSERIWVNVDSKAKMLSLYSLSGTVSWMVDSDKSSQSFWEAMRDILR